MLCGAVRDLGGESDPVFPRGNQLTIDRQFTPPTPGDWGRYSRWPVAVTAPNGRRVKFTVDTATVGEELITQARDVATGRTVSYSYNGSKRLASVTDTASGVTTYTYDGTSQRIESITWLTNTYDGNGRVTQQTFADSTTGVGPVSWTPQSWGGKERPRCPLQEALYWLGPVLEPVSRWFLEPGRCLDAGLLRRLRDVALRDDRPRVGVLYERNDRDHRGGLSLYVPETWDGGHREAVDRRAARGQRPRPRLPVELAAGGALARPAAALADRARTHVVHHGRR